MKKLHSSLTKMINKERSQHQQTDLVYFIGHVLLLIQNSSAWRNIKISLFQEISSSLGTTYFHRRFKDLCSVIGSESGIGKPGVLHLLSN